jgi:hypothetical protein
MQSPLLCNHSGRLSPRKVRPSVLDARFRGDPWLEPGEEGKLCLCLGNFSLATLSAVEFDRPSLNTILLRLREPVRHCDSFA